VQHGNFFNHRMTNGGAVQVVKIFSQRMTKCDAGHEKRTTRQARAELQCRTRMGHKRERNLRWAATVLESTVFLNFGVGRGPPDPPLAPPMGTGHQTETKATGTGPTSRLQCQHDFNRTEKGMTWQP
jgi:hypothetical protein